MSRKGNETLDLRRLKSKSGDLNLRLKEGLYKSIFILNIKSSKLRELLTKFWSLYSVKITINETSDESQG